MMKYLFCLCISTLILSCQQGININSPKAHVELLNSIQRIHLKCDTKEDSCIYSLTYIAPEINFLKLKKKNFSKVDLENFNNHKYDMVLFLFEFTPNSNLQIPVGKSFENYMTRDEKRSIYIMDKIKNDMVVKSKSDSLSPIFYHYEKMFGVLPSIRLQVGFNKKILEMQNPRFEFTNRLLNVPESIQLPISLDEIKKVPQLTL